MGNTQRVRGGHMDWTPEDLGVFVDQVRDDRFFAFWMLVATTGLPLDVLLDLQRGDIDFEARRITPGRLAQRTGVGAIERRSYALDPDAFEALRDHVIAWDKESHFAGLGKDLLFVWPSGEQLDDRAAYRMFIQHCEHAGLPLATIWAMRLAYVLAAVETGIPPRVIGERLGNVADIRPLKSGRRLHVAGSPAGDPSAANRHTVAMQQMHPSGIDTGNL